MAVAGGSFKGSGFTVTERRSIVGAALLGVKLVDWAEFIGIVDWEITG